MFGDALENELGALTSKLPVVPELALPVGYA